MLSAATAGDIEAAKIAHEAIARLLGSSGESAPVVELARVRRERGES
jgi:hypothetical protein